MSPTRLATILADIRSAASPEWLNGYVAGLREQGEMKEAAVTLAVRDKFRGEGWKFENLTLAMIAERASQHLPTAGFKSR